MQNYAPTYASNWDASKTRSQPTPRCSTSWRNSAPHGNDSFTSGERPCGARFCVIVCHCYTQLAQAVCGFVALRLPCYYAIVISVMCKQFTRNVHRLANQRTAGEEVTNGSANRRRHPHSQRGIRVELSAVR